MKDILNDLIQNASAIESIDLIKVAGTDKETTISAVSEDKSVIVVGTLKNPHPEFIGVFGMPNLSKLKTILSFEDYDEHANIYINKKMENNESIPDSIHFETKNGDFINEYRFMTKAIIEDKIKQIKIHVPSWDIEFEPSVASISRLKRQASANSEQDTFKTTTENGDLKVYFGDPSTHNGNFVFQSGVQGTLTNSWRWPVKQIITVLNLAGDKKMKISNQGAIEITVDSGLATYRYLFPAHTK